MRVRRAGSPKFKDSTQSKPVMHEGSDAVVESGGACRDAVGGDSAVGSQAELVPERLPRAPSASRTLPSAVLPAAQARLRGVTRWSTVEAGYHQFFVSSPATDPTSVTATGDVFDSGPNLVVVHTGVAAGPVRVGVFVLSGPPPGIDGVWEATAVEEIEATDDLLVVTTLGDVADDLGTVPVPSTGRLMVRVSRRGRDEKDWDQVVDEPVEEYLLEFWPHESHAGARRRRPAAKRDPYGDRVADASARLRGPHKTR